MRELVVRTYAPESEVSEEFLQAMAARMDVSFHKYGAVKDAYPHTLDAVGSLLDRIKQYQETGNTEWLVDAGNFAMIEFMHPGHPKAHFRATDSDESPGRVSRLVGRTHKANLQAR